MFKNENLANGQVKFVTKTEKKNKQRKAKKIERPELMITREEAQIRAENLLNWLRLTHPQNTGKGFKNAIEIKHLLRGDGESYDFYKPVLLFNLDDIKTLEILTDMFYETFKFSHCCYYSLYTFDNRKEVAVTTTDSDGRRTKVHKAQHKIVASNTVETSVLPIDIDNVTNEEYESYREYLLNLGIETLGLDSGNGYQMLILLDRPYKLKRLYADFTKKLHKLLPKVDLSINTATQVFRAPFTRNAKEYSSHFSQYKPNAPTAKEVIPVDLTEKRYSKKEIFDILDQEIERLNPKASESSVEVSEVEVIEDPREHFKEQAVVVTTFLDEKEKFERTYKYLRYEETALNVRKILQGVPEGLRNSSMMYLVPYLNNFIGLSQEQALETLEVFNELCRPALPSEIVRSEYYRISKNYGHYTRGLYSEDLLKEFGPGDLDTLIKRNIDKIKVDNEFIKKFDQIHHSAVRLYLTLKLLELEEEQKIFTNEEIWTAAGVSESTFRRYMKDLTRFSIVVRVRGNKRMGIKNGYKINEFGQYMNGFTLMSKSLIKLMLIELDNHETALYTYMLFKTRSMDVSAFFTSQKQIGEDLNLSQNAISDITDRLFEKKYIHKETRMGKQNRKNSTYTLRNE